MYTILVWCMYIMSYDFHKRYKKQIPPVFLDVLTLFPLKSLIISLSLLNNSKCVSYLKIHYLTLVSLLHSDIMISKTRIYTTSRCFHTTSVANSIANIKEISLVFFLIKLNSKRWPTLPPAIMVLIFHSLHYLKMFKHTLEVF